MLIMKKQLGRLAIIAVVTILAFFFARFDSFLYPAPVGQVTAVKQTSQESTTDEFGNQDGQYTQNLTVKLLNRSGQTVKIQNQVMASQTMTTNYEVGDQILLKEYSGSYQIDTIKRDSTLLALVALLVTATIIYVRFKKTSFLLLSVLLNAAVFVVALVVDVHVKSLPVVFWFSLVAVALAALSLYLVLGRSRQAHITLAATTITTALAVFVMWFVLLVTGGIGVHFETMSFVTQVPAPIFYAQTIIGVLGAVMDESADIVAGLFGLHRESPHRPFKDYWQAGLSVGREILGTLTNVLFMIFIAETIPMVILMLRNGNNWSYILDQVMNLGILQTVVSALGIVWAVPVTAGLTAWKLRHQEEEAAK
ncbi:Uncharacterized membrane protein [Fructobacillus tropaeoli]|nr:Uncharacterized membrane protein [Fructobacillus tropaeoli]